jgi:predicted Fe-Mo cluster-binding NifX family protein
LGRGKKGGGATADPSCGSRVRGGTMKLAIPVTSSAADAPVDLHFGRARFFRIVDTGTGCQEVRDNAEGPHAAHGAGTQAAQMLARAGVEGVLAGRVGPKAWSALQAAGIVVYLFEGGTLGQAIESFLSGKLERLSEPEPGARTSRKTSR